MDSFEYTRGDMTKEMKVSEDILELYQKERFDRLKIDHPNKKNRSPYNKIIKDDIRDCQKTILAVCEGRFPRKETISLPSFVHWLPWLMDSCEVRMKFLEMMRNITIAQKVLVVGSIVWSRNFDK